MASIEKSLENLGTDCVDVYLVHWPDHQTPFEETMRALEDVVREGKARFVGVSNFKREEIEACMSVRRVDVAQYGWNMFDRYAARRFPVLPGARHRRHGVRIPCLWSADGNVHPGRGLRLRRLARTRG
jgi:aryl-alcohol dehydrogenase-like predicted oxidoreductase